MKKQIKKCPKCGGEVFFINEEYLWEASYNSKTNKIDAYKIANNEISQFSCKNCGSNLPFEWQELIEFIG